MTNQISNVPKIRYQIVCLLSNSHFSALILWKLAAFCVERPYSFASRNRSRFAFLEKILSLAINRVNKRGGLRRLSFFYFSSLPLSCSFSSSIILLTMDRWEASTASPATFSAVISVKFTPLPSTTNGRIAICVPSLDFT